MVHGGAEEVYLHSRATSDGDRHTRLSVPTMNCGGCLAKIETTLARLEDVTSARVNLTSKYVDVTWREGTAPDLLGVIKDIGHRAHFRAPEVEGDGRDLRALIRALAVAGFATSNIMLLSIAVWSGAGGSYQHLFHLISAAIALPAIAYSGRSFFCSAWRALRRGRTNMDVPISVGIGLVSGLSLYDTFAARDAVYFEASVMLLLFLLIGKTLDQVMRDKVRNSVAALSRLVPETALVRTAEGLITVRVADIELGMDVLVAAGDRFPVDGVVCGGQSDVDNGLVTGESVPIVVAPGATVVAGARNIAQRLVVRVTKRPEETFLSQTIASMERAATNKAPHMRLADQAAQWFAPVIHAGALISFLLWMLSGAGWHQSLTIAAAVLIITCPCALGLAAPVVQVIAARKLFDRGILVRDGGALERLNDVDQVVIDKTGTLTTGAAVLSNAGSIASDHLLIAAKLALRSAHPYSRAIVDASRDLKLDGDDGKLCDDREVPGCGVEAHIGDRLYRLGRLDWARYGEVDVENVGEPVSPDLVLTCDGEIVERFIMGERLEHGAKPCIDALRGHGLPVTLLSGDQPSRVEVLCDVLGLPDWKASCRPADKLHHVEGLTAKGHKVLMVGDGLNDAPPLGAAHVAMTPSTAADAGRSSADVVYTSGDLRAVVYAIDIARASNRLVRQNFALAIIYNAIAFPLAVSGLVTPLIAALSMSASSIIVVVNGFRLKARKVQLGDASVGT